jgi:hypothetical protein
MIETAPVASHAAVIPTGVAKYNKNVVLINDRMGNRRSRCLAPANEPLHQASNSTTQLLADHSNLLPLAMPGWILPCSQK